MVARAVPAERLDLGRVGDLTIYVTERRRRAAAAGRQGRVSSTRSRSCGGATATWRSPCAPTSVDGVQAPDVTNQISPKLQDDP